MSTDWDLIQDKLHEYVVKGSGLPASQVRWAQQDAPRGNEPCIVMRLSLFDDVGMPWLDQKMNYITFDDVVVTAVNAGTGIFTKANHTLLTGDGAVHLTGSDLPLNTFTGKNYWAIRVDANSFKLADSFVHAMTGIAVTLGDAGSGTITVIPTNRTLRAGQEIRHMARTTVRVSLALEAHTYEGTGQNMATSLLNRVRSRSALPSQRALLEEANVGLSGFDRIFALMGKRDAFLFEPRASVNVQLVLPSEEFEDGTIIERTEITNLITGTTKLVDGG